MTLLERPGQVVTREDLRERLWKSDTFVDFEHGLNTAVKKARHALGDSAEAPQFIETLARKGYRFIGRVEPVDRPDTPLPSLPDIVTAPAVSARPPSVRRPALWGGGVVLALVLAVAGWLALPRPDRPHIAVVPFSVLSDAPGHAEYFGIGIADAITTRLANTGQIFVRPT
jgi:hypothetical protein